LKKKYIIIFSIFIVLLSLITVNASFFDGFFSGDSSNSAPNFSDMGITGNHSSDWFSSKNLNISITDKGTVLKNNGKENAFYVANKPSTTKSNTEDFLDWNCPYVVEFDVVSDNGSLIQIFDKENSTSRTFKQLETTSNSHVKLENDGNTIKYYGNGVNDPIFIFNGHSFNNSAIRFVIPPNSSLIYKNFTIYEK